MSGPFLFVAAAQIGGNRDVDLVGVGQAQVAHVAGEILEAWWNSLWQWSQRAAVSGRGVDKCIFRELLK